MDEAGEQVEPGVALPDPLPQVRGAVPVRVRRVALPAVVAQVERQEPRRLARQPGRHRDRLGVDREVHDRPPAERHVLRVAVRAVLRDRVLDALAGQRVLQLRRRDRDAVHEQAQVERLGRVRARTATGGSPSAGSRRTAPPARASARARA